MKICLFSDNHWSQYSSIIRKRGKKYSTRLENQIQSINWTIDLAESLHCSYVICLGDFFDKAELNAEEISALNDLTLWNHPYINFIFLAGNHEMGISTHEYSSAKVFSSYPNHKVITEPTQLQIGGVDVRFLPYILESERKPIASYFSQIEGKMPRLILSHNDIQGVQMGKFVSTSGFPIEEIESSCDLCINGHLHNGGIVSDKIINIGNLTGQNFSEDALRYDHCAFILDTNTLKIDVYENPYAFNFYKLNWDTGINSVHIKQNSVCTIKCKKSEVPAVKEWVELNSVTESRIIIQPELDGHESEPEAKFYTVDHLNKFQEYILSTFEPSDYLTDELMEVCR